MPRTLAHSPKTKKSFTLTAESVSFLERLRRKRRAASVSSVLEDIVQSARETEEKRTIAEAITAYYDCFTEADRDEERHWGDYALHQLSEKEF